MEIIWVNLHQNTLVSIQINIKIIILHSLQGQHRIDILFGNVPIHGSPFFTEVYDPSQIRIGPLSKDMFVGVETIFDISMENAGNVPLEITIISPSGLNSKNLFRELFPLDNLSIYFSSF